MAKARSKETNMARARGGPKGQMTVAEAGRKGGLTVRDERGHEFYEEIGRKGGHKVRDLIAAGKRALERK
jgi:general stress protein YciG